MSREIQNYMEVEFLKTLSYESINKIINDYHEKNEKLKDEKEELLECLVEFVKISNKYYGDATDTHLFTRSLATGVVMGIIEKITGKTIKEVLKNE